jgi:3-hydroxy-D-aspartate aldolase
MPIDRREFLAATLATGAALAAAPSPAADREERVRTKDDLPTPALLVDLDKFEANLKKMAEHCQRAGRAWRPHAKTHKCPEIARRQVAAGAKGVCVATVPEAEAMVAAGIPGVLLTSPIVERGKIARMAALAGKGDVMLSVGHARQVELLAQAAEAARTVVSVLVDIDVGDRRTGVLPGEPAVELARLIGRSKHLKLVGLQAYAGHASHVVGFEARDKASRLALAKAIETRDLVTKAGIETAILSGGSTGTYNIDSTIAGVTELQSGSFIFMDADYRRIGGESGAVYLDFQPALTVLATVVSATHPGRAVVDAGIKALATDVASKPELIGRPGLEYTLAGDEFGVLAAIEGAAVPALGDRVEMIVPHCDPTVNLYDRIYAVRGPRVEATWAISARRESEKL